MTTLNVGPSPNLSSWAFLSDSLKIATCSAKTGIKISDDHYRRTEEFYNCLLKLRERMKVDFDSEIFSLYIDDRINYAQIQIKLTDYCTKRDINYKKFINDLIEANKGILEGKLEGKVLDIDLFYNMAEFLGQFRSFN